VKKTDVIAHFGSVVNAAKALGDISPQAISQWPETIPQGRAYQIEILTGGTLKAITQPITPIREAS